MVSTAAVIEKGANHESETGSQQPADSLADYSGPRADRRRPNYITTADIGVSGSRALLFVTMNKNRYTNSGVKERGTFSLNVPTVDLVKETDFCGLVSGRKTDKSKLFSTFYGDLGTAPMMRACSINMKFKLIQTAELSGLDLYIGVVSQAYCNADYLSDGTVDFSRVHPAIFLMNNRTYWKLGEAFAHARGVRKELERRN